MQGRRTPTEPRRVHAPGDVRAQSQKHAEAILREGTPGSGRTETHNRMKEKEATRQTIDQTDKGRHLDASQANNSNTKAWVTNRQKPG